MMTERKRLGGNSPVGGFYRPFVGWRDFNFAHSIHILNCHRIQCQASRLRILWQISLACGMHNLGLASSAQVENRMSSGAYKATDNEHTSSFVECKAPGSRVLHVLRTIHAESSFPPRTPPWAHGLNRRRQQLKP